MGFLQDLIQESYGNALVAEQARQLSGYKGYDIHHLMSAEDECEDASLEGRFAYVPGMRGG